MDKGQKNEQAAIKALAQINAKVMGIDANSAGTATLAGMLKQIDTIRTGLDKIEETIKARQSGSGSERTDEE